MPRDYKALNTTPAEGQRRPEYRREDDWIRSFLQRGRIAHIATAWDDQPFINPSTYWYDEAQQRLIFHSNISGRVRANIEHQPRVCVEVSEMGAVLPSNVALEFSLQYRSVVIFGNARLLSDPDEQRAVMQQVIGKYFGELQAGREYRPVTDSELKRTTVYEVSIESWSGKENWKERADQSDEWPPLDEKWFGQEVKNV